MYSVRFGDLSSSSYETSLYVSSSCLYDCTLLTLHRSLRFLPSYSHHDAHVHICSALHFRRITSRCTDGDFQEGKLNYFLAPRNT